jgi:hypothetical protein
MSRLVERRSVKDRFTMVREYGILIGKSRCYGQSGVRGDKPDELLLPSGKSRRDPVASGVFMKVPVWQLVPVPGPMAKPAEVPAPLTG